METPGTSKCSICGKDEGAHQPDTRHCPMPGTPRTSEGYLVFFESTFTPSFTRKDAETVIRLHIRKLGMGAFEAKSTNGTLSSELRYQAIEDGAPASYTPVLRRKSIDDLLPDFAGNISKLEHDALMEGKDAIVAMDLNHFKQITGWFSRK